MIKTHMSRCLFTIFFAILTCQNASSAQDLLKEGAWELQPNKFVLGRIRDVTIDKKRRILYVLERQDTNVSVIIYNIETEDRCRVGSFGKGPGQFTSPVGMFKDGKYLYVVESNKRISKLYIPSNNTCEDLDFSDVGYYEQFPLLNSVCKSGRNIYGFDDNFVDERRFIHILSVKGNRKESFGIVPDKLYGNIYAKGSGKVYCIDTKYIAVSYNFDFNGFSLFSTDGRLLDHFQLSDYKPVSIATKEINGKEYSRWVMNNRYRTDELTFLDIGDESKPRILVHIRKYISSGPDPESNVINYIFNVHEKELIYAGETKGITTYIDDEYRVVVQQPDPIPRVLVYTKN